MTGDNVSQLHGDPSKLRQRAREFLGHLRHGLDVEPQLERPYLVKGWLDRGGLSVLFGPSNTGKSFLALDMAHHVARGLRWGGHRVRRGRVVYLAAEGGAGFTNRVAALDHPEFWVAACPITLTGKESQSRDLVDTLNHLTAVGGEPFDLIVVDTLARVMGGSDENLAPAIAELLDGLDYIRRATGAHVMVVHHSRQGQQPRRARPFLPSGGDRHGDRPRSGRCDGTNNSGGHQAKGRTNWQ